MKTGFEKETSAPRGNGFGVAIVAALSVGLGVTGTMLWMQSRPSTPISTPTSAPAILDVPNAQNLPNPAAHEPPAQLTAGMAPPQAALTLGNWYYDHEKWDLAISHYRVALADKIDNPDVRTDLGNALRFSNQPQKALEQYQIAQKQNPRHEQSLFNQGALYAASMNNPKKGIEVWQTYLNRFPGGQSAAAARSLIVQAQNGG
jgi:tetratricopeptide (TPR) repeat protein